MQCGATNRFTLCLQMLYRYCRNPSPVSSSSCVNTVASRCRSSSSSSQKLRCVQFAMQQCLAQAVCTPRTTTTRRPEISTTVPASPCRKDSHIGCTRYSVQCGATSRFTLCRNVLYKYCRNPQPTARSACSSVVNVRCSSRDRAQKARCVQFATTQCLAQSTCAPATTTTRRPEVTATPVIG